MVFHDQRLNVKSNIEKIVHLPVFHAGPILRGEEPFDNADPKERNCFNPSLSSRQLCLSNGLRSSIGRENSRIICPFKDASSGILDDSFIIMNRFFRGLTTR